MLLVGGIGLAGSGRRSQTRSLETSELTVRTDDSGAVAGAATAVREHSFSTGGDEARADASKGARGGLPATLNGGAALDVAAEDEGATALGTGASRHRHDESTSAGEWRRHGEESSGKFSGTTAAVGAGLTTGLGTGTTGTAITVDQHATAHDDTVFGLTAEAHAHATAVGARAAGAGVPHEVVRPPQLDGRGSRGSSVSAAAAGLATGLAAADDKVGADVAGIHPPNLSGAAAAGGADADGSQAAAGRGDAPGGGSFPLPEGTPTKPGSAAADMGDGMSGPGTHVPSTTTPSTRPATAAPNATARAAAVSAPSQLSGTNATGAPGVKAHDATGAGVKAPDTDGNAGVKAPGAAGAGAGVKAPSTKPAGPSSPGAKTKADKAGTANGTLATSSATLDSSADRTAGATTAEFNAAVRAQVGERTGTAGGSGRAGAVRDPVPTSPSASPAPPGNVDAGKAPQQQQQQRLSSGVATTGAAIAAAAGDGSGDGASKPAAKQEVKGPAATVSGPMSAAPAAASAQHMPPPPPQQQKATANIAEANSKVAAAKAKAGAKAAEVEAVLERLSAAGEARGGAFGWSKRERLWGCCPLLCCLLSAYFVPKPISPISVCSWHASCQPLCGSQRGGAAD